MSKIKLFIAEDHHIVLAGMVKLFENDLDFEVVGTASTCAQAVEEIMKSDPDVLLTDISFPDGDGISLIQKIRIKKGQIKTICLTMHKEQGYVAKAYEAGIEGYLLKETELNEIKTTIKGVVAGQKFYGSTLFDFKTESVVDGTLKEKLTLRELEVIKLVCDGLTSKKIADKLFLSVYTIDTHRKNIYSKLNIDNMGALIKMAHDEGLIID